MIMDFRIISKNGEVDLPYSAGLLVEKRSGIRPDVFTYIIKAPWNGEAVTMGTYETREQVLDVLKKVREAYSSFLFWYSKDSRAETMADCYYQFP